MTDGSSQPYVFVSYASADRERVLGVADALASAGIATWLDQRSIDAGMNWGEEIADAIAGCSAFILMSSAAALSSRNVRQEIALAWKYGKPYLPLLLDATPFPREIEYWLETAQWVEVLDRPVSEWLPRVQRALERRGSGFGIRDWDLELGNAPVDPAPISRNPQSPIPNPDPRPPTRRIKPFLAGREREQGQLEGWLDETLAGRGGVVLVGGEAGIGKTTLTNWLLWRAEERGALALAGGCYDLATTAPYGPWGEILRGWPGANGGLPEVPQELRPGTGMGNVQSQAAFFALAGEFLVQAASARPLVLLLEDLHWSDQASLDFLRYAARLVAETSLLVVCTWREDELTRRHPLSALLPTLARERGAHRLMLSRLDDAGLSALISARYPLPEADHRRLVAYVQELTEGNPFFAGEVLQSIDEQGALVRGSDGWRVAGLERMQIPALVRQVIESRLTRLTDDARRLLEVAAVIGQEVPLDLWVAVSGADDITLAETLEQATDARLVEETADRAHFRFTHALVRETLYAGLVSLRLRAWHRVTAEALLRGPRPVPDAVAHHLQQAGDPRAFDWLVRAGDLARSSYAWLDAVERYERAVALVADDPAREQERGWLLYRIALLLRGTAPRRSVGYAVAAAEAGIATGDRTLSAFATFVRGSMIGLDGDIDSGLELVRAGAAAAEALTVADLERSGPLLTTLFGEEPTVDRARLADYVMLNPTRGTEVTWLVFAGYYAEALAKGEALIAAGEGRDLPPPARHTYYDALYGCATAYAICGQPDRARAYSDRALAGYVETENYFALRVAGTIRFGTYTWRYAIDDEMERAYTLGMRTEAEARLSGAAWVNFDGLSGSSSSLARVEDRWDDLVRFWTAAATDDQQIRIFRRLAPARIGWVARHRGQSDNARAAVAMLLEQDRRLSSLTRVIGADIDPQLFLIEMYLDSHELDHASHWLGVLERHFERTGAIAGRADAALLWSRYHLVGGDRASALAHAERALTLASNPRQPLLLVAAHRTLGELLTASGELDAADAHLSSALSLANPIGIRSEIAWTQLALAELHAARGEHEQARALLAEVRAVFEPLGAQPTLERAAALEQRLNS
jgi:tetratricopeptide (TPR) repeat protein